MIRAYLNSFFYLISFSDSDNYSFSNPFVSFPELDVVSLYFDEITTNVKAIIIDKAYTVKHTQKYSEGELVAL